MPVKLSKANIVAKLDESAKRLKKVRDEAEKIRELGQLAEPEPQPLQVTIVQRPTSRQG